MLGGVYIYSDKCVSRSGGPCQLIVLDRQSYHTAMAVLPKEDR